MRRILIVTLAAGAALAGPSQEKASRLRPQGELDLEYKAEAERLSLFADLFADAKLACDDGFPQDGVEAFDRLLGLKRLDAATRGLAQKAREGCAAALAEAQKKGPVARRPNAPAALPAPPVVAVSEPAAPAKPEPVPNEVVGSVSLSGGPPGGTVITLRPIDREFPAPRARRPYTVRQEGKSFRPHVLVVPVGATVEFPNMDTVFHNVFSLAREAPFDLGLYKSGESGRYTFERPGVVQILCNIHTSMTAWVFVTDTPYYAVAGADGRFRIKDVAPGKYRAEAWHEMSKTMGATEVVVRPGRSDVKLQLVADRADPAFVPDKYGKPRQAQLGY